MARPVKEISRYDGLSGYHAAIRRQPMLEPEEELELARAWRARGCRDAHRRLVESHLRLVARIARLYSGYGLPAGDLISEGNLGLLQALDGFDPERGVRFSTYATYWIRATIQEHILRCWSLVRIGTTSSQKRLFFNLRRLRARITTPEGSDLTPDAVEVIARELGVTEADVVRMDRRISRADRSLNERPPGMQSGQFQDLLVDETADHEAEIGQRQEHELRMRLVTQAMQALHERERRILIERRLAEKPMRLEDLSRLYGISRERVRQIENGALEKLRRLVLGAGRETVPA